MGVLDSFKLDGKTAVVTGAGRGLGRAMAIALAEAGADVAILARTKTQINETAGEIEALGRKSVALPLDLTSPEDIAEAVERIIRFLGRIDILVNNAGMAIVKPLVPMPNMADPLTEEDLNLMFKTNLFGPFFVTQAVGRHFMERGRGKVINVTSVTALRAGGYQTSYAASKAGLLQFTVALANEWARHNISVNAIAPGAFHTQMSDKVYQDEELLKKMHARIPMSRSGKPEELGPAVVFLASSASDYVTGAVIPVDGGYLVF